MSTRPTPPAPRPWDELPDPMLVREAAQQLRCSSAHLLKLIQSDGLKAVRWGINSRCVRIYKDDLREYISRKRGIK